ncbi:hypothetical protein PI124_g15608 [Phytophthora idaei]|nr:hypothetical protein PI125_g16119 [Phytophthora idaei]KAG3143493.1 hypothetical protein PI126_g14595 [Phytophthora idaei]KAG3239456.1 hypothetical protein PI124_g15608 [Phytophthora idaei]
MTGLHTAAGGVVAVEEDLEIVRQPAFPPLTPAAVAHIIGHEPKARFAAVLVAGNEAPTRVRH